MKVSFEKYQPACTVKAEYAICRYGGNDGSFSIFVVLSLFYNFGLRNGESKGNTSIRFRMCSEWKVMKTHWPAKATEGSSSAWQKYNGCSSERYARKFAGGTSTIQIVYKGTKKQRNFSRERGCSFLASSGGRWIGQDDPGVADDRLSRLAGLSQEADL